MSIATEITRLQNAKSSIKTAIENKGVTVGDELIDTYAEKIDQISSGGSTVEINDCAYLFYQGYRSANYADILSICKDVIDTSSMFQDNCEITGELDLSGFDVSQVEYMDNMFNGMTEITSINMAGWNTANVLSFQGMFKGTMLETINCAFNTAKATIYSYMFEDNENLTTLDLSTFNFIKALNITNIFNNCSSLTTLSALPNLGRGYRTNSVSNYANYTLDLSTCVSLTEQSLINVLNGLYDIKTKGCNAQKCIIGTDNIAKLTSTEGQQALTNATNNGWTVS